jgi:DNA-binding response OmpR family regulator
MQQLPSYCASVKENPILKSLKRVPVVRRAKKHSPYRILVVEPNADLRLLYTDVLAGSDCEVDVAEDGGTAWQALQARRYHLLFAENDPPALTGDELIGRLRSAGMELPVVLTSGRLARAGQARNSSFPFAATLQKPFVLEALMDTLTNVLRTAAHTGKDLPRRFRFSHALRTTVIRPADHYEIASSNQAINFR